MNASDMKSSEHDPDDSVIPIHSMIFVSSAGLCLKHAENINIMNVLNGVTVTTRKTRSMLLGEVGMHVFDVSGWTSILNTTVHVATLTLLSLI